MDAYPGYVALHRSGELAERARLAERQLRRCTLCPRRCRVDRTRGGRNAVCHTGTRARISSWMPHRGEERCLSGRNGSGTIFFGGCNLRCEFCQNWEISWEDVGEEVSDERLAGIMLDLQASGCHNVNLVSPSHVVAQILAALVIAVERGFRLPLVYNSGGYDEVGTLELLDEVVDIYLVDMKYADSELARRYSRVRRYTERNRDAVREMHRQVGDLVLDDDGIARRGLMVRHLVMPGQIAGSPEVMRFIAEEVSDRTWVNVMDQYRPCHRADLLPELARPITRSEYDSALDAARAAGLRNLVPDSVPGEFWLADQGTRAT